MSQHYPKKGFGSYLLPFILIIVLLGSGWYIINYNLNLDDLWQLFQGPEVAKDERVSIAYLDGENEVKPWNDENWETLEEDHFLQAGDTLRTNISGTIVLRFFEGSELRITGQSEVKLIRMDKNERNGDHVAVELVSGKLWVHSEDPIHEESDLIINTPQQIIQINQASLIDVGINPEITHVVGGAATLNISQRLNGTRKPISRLDIRAGQQLLLDDLIIDELKSGDKDVLTGFTSEYLESEWYLWNIEQDKKLGLLVDVVTEAPQVDLEELEAGLVNVSNPKSGDALGASVLVQGSYDPEQITTIWVNGEEATLGLTDEWELTVGLSEYNNTITVTAQEKDSEKEKLVESFTVEVDASGPIFGNIIQPSVDENDNGILEGDSLELIGEIGSDATKVCVSHNGSSPYCLQAFSAGDDQYRYLGSVSYGNVESGKNQYTITATDKLGNTSSKTIYLFKDEEKPDERLTETTTSNSNSTNTVELLRPTINEPNPSETYETSEETVTISGKVDSRSASLLVNGLKAGYSAGSDSFEVTIDVELGENLITLQTVDQQGNKSKSALLTVLRSEPDTKESESEE